MVPPQLHLPCGVVEIVRGDELEALDAHVQELVGGSLAGVEGFADDVAELEHAALSMRVPFDLPDLPPEWAASLPRALERRADEPAAGLLLALAAFAHPPLAYEAANAAARLSDRGVVSPVADRIGTLEVVEARRHAMEGAEAIVLMLRRRGVRRAQLGLVGIESYPCGDVIVKVDVSPPDSLSRVRSALSATIERSAPVPVAPEELLERLRAAAAHMAEHEIALEGEVAVWLPAVARALAGRSDVLPQLWVDLTGEDRSLEEDLDDEEPLLDAPDLYAEDEEDDEELLLGPLDVDPEDEDDTQETIGRLLDEFEEHLAGAHGVDEPIARHGGFVASSLLDWKAGYGDGRLARWTAADLEEYLLDFCPRKVSGEDELLSTLPDAVAAFLRFLDDTGRREGPEPLEVLVGACARLAPVFERAMRDPRRWGPAKAMVMAMLEEGIDPGEPGALETWMTEFNSRPREERDRVLGRSRDAMLPSSTTPAPRRPPERRKRDRRRATRAARKRNRR